MEKAGEAQGILSGSHFAATSYHLRGISRVKTKRVYYGIGFVNSFKWEEGRFINPMIPRAGGLTDPYLGLVAKKAPTPVEANSWFPTIVLASPTSYAGASRKLVTDPVRAPSGYIFERAVLARALAESNGVCPVTGQPLTLQDCPRDPDLRRRAVAR